MAVLRSTSARAFMSIYFVFAMTLFLLAAFTNRSSAAFPIVLVVLCLFGLFRSVRCGYVAISQEELIVRTLVRTRVFRLKDIRDIEVREYIQFSTRVRAVLILDNGQSYPLSEFFLRKSLYNSDLKNNKISNLIGTVKKFLTDAA